MAIRVHGRNDFGARVPGPPEGWRPRALTIREKLQIVVNQSGRDPDGSKLKPMLEGVDFDHTPALQRRRWDPIGQDTIPAACDLNFIIARNKKNHAVKTAGEDIPEIHKTRRLEGAKEARARKRSMMRSAGFPKRLKERKK